MSVYGVYHDPGRISLDWRESLEEWSSIEGAGEILQLRARGGLRWIYPVSFDDEGIPTHPGLQEGFFAGGHYSKCYIDLFDGCDYSECYIDLFDLKSGEPYMRLTLSPRGGVRRERF